MASKKFFDFLNFDAICEVYDDIKKDPRFYEDHHILNGKELKSYIDQYEHLPYFRYSRKP